MQLMEENSDLHTKAGLGHLQKTVVTLAEANRHAEGDALLAKAMKVCVGWVLEILDNLPIASSPLQSLPRICKVLSREEALSPPALC